MQASVPAEDFAVPDESRESHRCSDKWQIYLIGCLCKRFAKRGMCAKMLEMKRMQSMLWGRNHE